VSRPLNLATRPLRNERLPTAILAVACLVLVGLTVRHAFAVRDLLPERTAAVDGELVALEQEVARLRAEFRELQTRSATPEALEEWAVVRGLVDRRAFSWSELLAHLEEVVPPNVRLTSIAPAGEEGQVELTVQAVARSVDDGLAFLEALQRKDVFQDPFLTSVNEVNDEIDVPYTMTYVPTAAPPDAAGEGP
jgi:Tfp pilus assembly protein PilN